MTAGNLKLAIVDDEALARDRLRSMVSDIGGWDIVAEAGNGREALDKIMADPPDAVLLDIRMPGVDGMEVAEQLCELNPAPTVVFTTASVSDAKVRRRIKRIPRPYGELRDSYCSDGKVEVQEFK